MLPGSMARLNPGFRNALYIHVDNPPDGAIADYYFKPAARLLTVEYAIPRAERSRGGASELCRIKRIAGLFAIAPLHSSMTSTYRTGRITVN